MNNLKQIALATQSFSGTYSGTLPCFNGTNYRTGAQEHSLFIALMPYLEQDSIYRGFLSIYPGGSAGSQYVVSVYVSPADPSIPALAKGTSSYAANAVMFAPRMTLNRVSDGQSNTIAYAEHYAFNCGGSMFSWAAGMDGHFPNAPPGGVKVLRSAVFANRAAGDVYPVTVGATTQPSVPGLAFQVAPSLKDCDPRIPQSPHASGMLVALADGSVRGLSAAVSQSTFWAAVTPAGGEVFGNDW